MEASAITTTPAPDVSPLDAYRLTDAEVDEATWNHVHTSLARSCCIHAIANAATLKALRGVAPMLSFGISLHEETDCIDDLCLGLKDMRALFAALEGAQP